MTLSNTTHNHIKVIIEGNEFLLEGIDISTAKLHSILETSNSNLEKDLETFIGKIKEIENAHHLWATTWSPLRLDDLEGVALYYFIETIIGTLLLELDQSKSKITLEGDFDGYYKSYINEKYPSLKIKKKVSKIYLRRTTGYYLGPLKYIFNVLFKRVSSEESEGNIWLSSSYNLKNHRYKHLLDRMNPPKAFYAGRLDASIDSSNKEVSLDFRRYISIKDILNCLVEALKLNREKRKIKPQSLIEYLIKTINSPQMIATIIKEKSVANAIKINKPERIFHTTANTFPPARIVARQAYIHNIPFVVVACRPMFTRSRLEERLIEADRLKTNNAHVADAYAVWDAYSKSTLIGQGVDPDCIYVTSPDIYKSKIISPNSKERFENALLLLFTHEERLNQKLIEEFVQLNISKNLIIRQHPLKRLTKGQLEQLSDKFEIISDITSEDYSNFEFINTIAITINSTALIEAVSHGCGAIWMPYLNSRAILFFEIMQQMGIIVNNVKDLENLLKQCEEDLNKLILACQKMYNIKFKAKDETNEFLQHMKLT